MAKVEWRQSELLAHVGFIVTNMTGCSRNVANVYNGRGKAEQWIKEGKYALKWTRLSCRNFKDNQARLQLFTLAYNLGIFLRRLAFPRAAKHGSLTAKISVIGNRPYRSSCSSMFFVGVRPLRH